jgi:hypothetical protein
MAARRRSHTAALPVIRAAYARSRHRPRAAPVSPLRSLLRARRNPYCGRRNLHRWCTPVHPGWPRRPRNPAARSLWCTLLHRFVSTSQAEGHEFEPRVPLQRKHWEFHLPLTASRGNNCGKLRGKTIGFHAARRPPPRGARATRWARPSTGLSGCSRRPCGAPNSLQEKGIHLHFALPDALSHGRNVKEGTAKTTTVFAPVPNRPRPSGEPSNHRAQEKSSHFRESADCTTAIRGPPDCRTSIWPPEVIFGCARATFWTPLS